MNVSLEKNIKRAKKFEEKGNLQAAHKIYKKITSKYPDEDMGWVCLGAVEDEISRQTDGLFGGKEAFCQALKLRMHPSIINDVGNILLRNELRWQEAEMFYREAVIRHGLENGAQNLAVCLLNTATVKRTPEGWREAWQWYEWRDMNAMRYHDRVWRGESLKGKRLLIQFEQGFGDHIWSFRFLKLAKAQGATVIALCQPNTIRLAIAQSYIDEVYNIKEDAKVEADYVCMLLSMPGYMLPNSMPVTEGRYLETGVEPEQHNIPRVGICWNGSVDKGYQSWRNINLDQLIPIMEMRPDVEFVSLQKGKHEDDVPELKMDRESIKACNDLWETAILVDTLDLVISTDTMIPHMSASLGKETWLLDRWSSCWQFGIGGPETDPHWYETLEIFKQQEYGDWTPVLEKIKGRFELWQPSLT